MRYLQFHLVCAKLLKLFRPRVETRGFFVAYATRTKLTKVKNKIIYYLF